MRAPVPQVSRRLRAALEDLKALASEDRQAPLDRQIALLDATIEAQFDQDEVVESARTPDPQGIGSATDIRPFGKPQPALGALGGTPAQSPRRNP